MSTIRVTSDDHNLRALSPRKSLDERIMMPQEQQASNISVMLANPVIASSREDMRSDDMNEQTEAPEEDIISRPLPPIFVTVQFGAAEVLIVNSNCRRKIFMDYLKKRIGVSASAPVDLCDTAGVFLKLDRRDANENVDHLFIHGQDYIPCFITKDGQGYIISIRPLLRHWKHRFPAIKDSVDAIIERDRQALEEARLRIQQAQIPPEKEKVAPEPKKKKGK